MVSSGIRKDNLGQAADSLRKCNTPRITNTPAGAARKVYQIAYCPESVVMHSHNYTSKEAYKRSFGEAKALAAVLDWKSCPNELGSHSVAWLV